MYKNRDIETVLNCFKHLLNLLFIFQRLTLITGGSSLLLLRATAARMSAKTAQIPSNNTTTNTMVPIKRKIIIESVD